jgi:hypothetical protein
MSKSLETRLEKLEAQHAGPSVILVTYDDERYTANGQTFTRGEVEAMNDPIVLKVVYEQAAQP